MVSSLENVLKLSWLWSTQKSGNPVWYSHGQGKSSANYGGVDKSTGRGLHWPVSSEIFMSLLEACLGVVLTVLVNDRRYQLVGRYGQLAMDARHKLEFKGHVHPAYWSSVGWNWVKVREWGNNMCIWDNSKYRVQESKHIESVISTGVSSKETAVWVKNRITMHDSRETNLWP